MALSNTASFSCIDINKDRVNDEADIDKLTDYAFRGVEIPEGTNVDLNEDGVVNILDVTMLINYIKRNGPTPSCAIVEPLVVMNSCGDTDGDNTLGQADLDAITSYAFEGVGVPGNVNADLNNDGVVDIVDVVTMTNYVKRDGEKPSCAEKLIVEEPESDVEENIVENPAVPPTGNSGGGSGGSQRTVIIAQNDEIADSTEETTSESEDPVSDTSLEDIEQRLDDLEQKVDENNKILEKILDFLGRFFKF